MRKKGYIWKDVTGKKYKVKKVTKSKHNDGGDLIVELSEEVL